jgi:hypothetical protein
LIDASWFHLFFLVATVWGYFVFRDVSQALFVENTGKINRGKGIKSNTNI